jgi:signal transduction histidine kinase
MTPPLPSHPRVLGSRVLIVEDESIVAKDLEMTLKALGYVPCGISDTGEEAIAKAELARPDIVLMDIRLRGQMDGIEAARAIFQRNQIPVVFLTAHADEATLRRAEGAQTFGYILKPFDERELHIALTIALCRHQAQSEVEEQVRQRTADLLRTEQQLREAINIRDEFLAIASHELRTPLTTLCLQVDRLAHIATSLNDTVVPANQVLSKAEVIGKQVDRLSALIDSLLDVSRAVAGRWLIEPQETNFRTVVDDVVARFKEAAHRVGSKLVVSGQRSCVGYWDRERLDQILGNLLSNAVKYGAGKPIEVRLESTGDEAVLTVTDHGIGIALAEQARIFEKFERAVSPRHFGGLGLGLWISKQIVAAMNGSISVQSTPGEGSVFTVSLPRGETAALRSEEASPEMRS